MVNTKIESIEKYWNDNYNHLCKKLNLKKNLTFPGKHLDFGCGIGYFTYLLAFHNPLLQIEGIDIDNKSINIANSRYTLPNLKYHNKNSPKGIYNSISAILSLHETNDARKTLSLLHDCLNVNGKLLIYDFRKTSRDNFKKLYEKNPDPDKLPFEYEYLEHNKWSIEEFENMLNISGFTTISLECSNNHHLAYIGRKQTKPRD